MADFVRVPPDSTGKKITHRQDGDLFTQIVHVGDKDDPELMQRVDQYGASLITFNEGQPSLDAFGNLRVSEEWPVAAYDNVTGPQDELYYIETENGGTQAYNSQSSSVTLGTNGTIGSKSTRTTNRYHHYVPGTGMLGIFTLALGDSGKTGNVRQWGMFDDENGMFFSVSEEESISVIIRSSATGTVQNETIERQNWNGDRLDGTGLSGYNIDLTKRNLYWISFAWLGVGAVRFGVFGGKGERILCHTVQNVNGPPFPYTRTGTLPMRFNNEDIAATGSSSEIKFICAAIYSDVKPAYTFWRYSDVISGLREVTTNTPILSVRPKLYVNGTTIFNRTNSFPENLSLYVSEGNVKVSLYWWTENDLTGASWQSSAGLLEFDNSSTSIDLSDNYPMATYYFGTGSHNLDLRDIFELNDEGILLSAGNIQHSLTFVVTKLSGATVNIDMTLTHRELY